MANGEIVRIDTSVNDAILRDLFKEATIQGDWRHPAIIISQLGRTARPEQSTHIEVIDVDEVHLDELLEETDTAYDSLKKVPIREEIQRQRERLETIDAQIVMLNTMYGEAKERLRTEGKDLKEKIKEKTISVNDSRQKKDAAIERHDLLKAEIEAIPDIVAEGIDSILDNTNFQSIADVQGGLGELGKRSLGSTDNAIKILEYRTAKTLMVNAIKFWELESQELERLTEQRLALITRLKDINNKILKEKDMRSAYTTKRVAPAGHLITETTRRDRIASAVIGMGQRAVDVFRKSPKLAIQKTQLIAEIEQNG